MTVDGQLLTADEEMILLYIRPNIQAIAPRIIKSAGFRPTLTDY